MTTDEKKTEKQYTYEHKERVVETLLSRRDIYMIVGGLLNLARECKWVRLDSFGRRAMQYNGLAVKMDHLWSNLGDYVTDEDELVDVKFVVGKHWGQADDEDEDNEKEKNDESRERSENASGGTAESAGGATKGQGTTEGDGEYKGPERRRKAKTAGA